MKKLSTKLILVQLVTTSLTLSTGWSRTYTNQDLQSLVKSDYTSWGIQENSTNSLKMDSSVGLAKAFSIFEMKKPVTVAVVDTGINVNHPFLKNNIYVDGVKATNTNFGRDFSGLSGLKTPHDTHGHGTHVAGIIKSIFPDVRILPVKYFNPNASGAQNLISTIKALQYAVDSNVDIINYSGGGPEASSEEKKVLEEAQKKGIIVVAAAGNDGTNIDTIKQGYYPASYRLPNIISVSSYNQSLELLSSSNWGNKTVDIAAPGHRINSPFTGTTVAAIKVAGYKGNGLASAGQDAEMMTGTSQATAFVTGVAALVKSMYPQLTYGQVREAINKSADQVPNFLNKIISNGKLNAYSALIYAKNLSSEGQNIRHIPAPKTAAPGKTKRSVARN